jgi:hypothetical protein
LTHEFIAKIAIVLEITNLGNSTGRWHTKCSPIIGSLERQAKLDFSGDSLNICKKSGCITNLIGGEYGIKDFEFDKKMD